MSATVIETRPPGAGPGGCFLEAVIVSYAQSDLIDVFTFTRQREGEEVVIGRPETNAFLALPVEVLDILDNLSRGKTIGETRAEFARVHGVEPDLDDLLGVLEQRGFVRLRGHGGSRGESAPAAVRAADSVRYHFANIPESFAKRFFGPLPMTLYLTTIAAALIVAAADPSLIPDRFSLFFSEHRTAKIVVLSLIAYGSIFLHEFAHLLAARAQGVKSRIGISNRLWFLVAETDMTGLWAVPKRQRYLPMLAGPLLDSFSASLLCLLLFAQKKGALTLDPALEQIVRAMIFIYMFRLFWQCFLFVRTDFYYVLTTFLGCKNLMRDTQVFIRNLCLRLVGSPRLTDQSNIPARERKLIRLYSLLWVAGRGLAFFSLFFITLPVLFRYVGGAALALRRGYDAGVYQLIDSVVVAVLNLTPLVVGLYLWLVSLARKRRIA